MKNITEVTKKDIMNLFKNGIADSFYEEKKYYNYNGRTPEIVFLNNLYNLKEMKSNDTRYKNAEDDIIQHAINNDDYTSGWIFEDERFNLMNVEDEIYLKFICEIFNPQNRDDKCNWRIFLDEINKLLRNDKYELYVSTKISNHDVYDWNIYDNKIEEFFIPFSQRYKEKIDRKIMNFSIGKRARSQIYSTLKKYNLLIHKTDDTGWNETTRVEDEVFSDISQFEEPKCYINNVYCKTNNMEKFINFTRPYNIMDVIEYYYKYNKDINADTKFDIEINEILKCNNIDFFIKDGKIVSTINKNINITSLENIEEAGLKELVQKSIDYFEKDNKSIAVEKIWDALERLKTYYSPNKKDSIKKIIKDMSNGQSEFEVLFNKEFMELTYIGNNFRIRHHEMNKIEIYDDFHYEYFFKRCILLINTAIKYLKNSSKL